MSKIMCSKIHISGIVQGVGFRPFIYSLAKRMKLNGWVRNTSAGVDIEVDGSPEQLELFTDAINTETPPLAKIEKLDINHHPPNGFSKFEIIQSKPIPGAYQPVSPDISICSDCLVEIFDPSDRRFKYSFTNCTNCGPRFTIIEDLPYDRRHTTMNNFIMCSDCSDEYTNPLDRRFHAQPVACPVCGPDVFLSYTSDTLSVNDISQQPTGLHAIREIQSLLIEGKIVAIKGLGGFHLACDATNSYAVKTLRERKQRIDKPLALMMPDISTIELHCELNDREKQLLLSPERPIVLLQKLQNSDISVEISPHQKSLGVMLPYTPLHYLLFSKLKNNKPGTFPSNNFTPALVMTSGNKGKEPIEYANVVAADHLSDIADAFLMHNRSIHNRCDDSVLRVTSGGIDKAVRTISDSMPSPTENSVEYHLLPIRLSRGYTPKSDQIPWSSPSVLAVGAELKNTFCLTRENNVILSHHIGNLDNFESLQAFEESINHYQQLFRVSPSVISYDLHPDYLSTRYALDRAKKENLITLGIQHHYAHTASCIFENDLVEQSVIGVAFDGTGYGDDGNIWGGEFFTADLSNFQRMSHLPYIPLPGAEKSIREPWRFALACLDKYNISWDKDLPPIAHAFKLASDGSNLLTVIKQQLDLKINSPLTSSMGRLFDSISSLCNIRQSANYEAQAAIELEALVDPDESGIYPINVDRLSIDLSPLFHYLVKDLRSNIPINIISARFHNSMAYLVVTICKKIRGSTGINDVVLSGGVWQNITLLSKTIKLLYLAGFKYHTHNLIPPNDGGLSFGQAIITSYKYRDQ